MTDQPTKAKSRAPCILVLGMHRSGTSALTGSLHHLGVNLGSPLMAADEKVNPRGFFEHQEIAAFHEEILFDLGRTWDDLRPSLDLQFSEAQIERLCQLIDRHFQPGRLWAVKDPRLCRLLGLWKPALEASDYQPRALFIHRHPQEVAQSLARRDGFSFEKSAYLWLDHTLTAEKETRGWERCWVSYNALLDDPIESLEKIATALEVEWPTPLTSDLQDFLSPELRHHAAGEPAGPALGRFQAECRELHDELNRVPIAGGSPKRAVLDRCRKATEKATKLDPLLLEQVFGDRRHLRQEVYDATAELAHHRGVLQRQSAGLDELHHRVDAVAAELQRASRPAEPAPPEQDPLATEIAEIRSELGALQELPDRVAQVDAEVAKAIATLRADRSETLRHFNATQDRLGDLEQRSGSIGTLRDQLHSVEGRQSELDKALANLRQQLKRLSGTDLADLTRKVTALSGRHGEATKLVAEQAEMLERLQETVAEVENAATPLAADLGSARNQLDSLTAHVATGLEELERHRGVLVQHDEHLRGFLEELERHRLVIESHSHALQRRRWWWQR